ncbi:MAG: SDR family NAD(P)-dependent oxidoreductase [Gammaproteobacteria bacterium]|nr:SDR family NAD(P)-dependent oxidoreductase [Gammaproteobacteria bacterium]MDH3429542.1 SDR family NAD(P)-dependent oxidoreductase [Gammaproteobacteria bacterium]
MRLLPSLHANANVAVIGASGGIGRGFVELLAADSEVQNVYAFSRSPVHWPAANVHDHRIDIVDEASIENAAAMASANGPLDLVIVASGILHRDPVIQPEKSLSDLNSRALTDVLAVNTIGPALAGKHFLPKLRRKHKTVFAALSARVGSINDNRLGGWASYRMSKAALNMFVRTASIEQSRSLPESVVVALHPGTVETALSCPFTRRLDSRKLFSPTNAARQLLHVIDELKPAHSGGFFAYDHARIDF